MRYIQREMFLVGKVRHKLAFGTVLVGILGCGGGSSPSHLPPGTGGGIPGFHAASTQQWVQQFGLGNFIPPPNETFPAQNILMGVATDGQGNSVVGAYTNGAYPGFSDPKFSAEDVMVKFDPAGKHLWLQEIGTGQGDFLSGIAVDTQGNTYAVATTNGSFPGYSNPSNTRQGVIFKLGPDGNMLWLQQLSALSHANPQSIAVTSSGDVIVGFQSVSLSGSSPDGFLLVHLDGATGQTLMQQSYASSNYTLLRLTVDSAGNVLVIGWGGLPGYTTTNPGAPLVVKIDGATGNILWGQALASYEAVAPITLFGVSTDSQDDVLVGGAVGSAQYGISVGYIPAPEATCILAKLDGATGNTVWVKQFGTGAGDEIYSVAVDASGNVLAAGTTYGIFSSPFVQPQDLNFVMKFTPDGQDTWVQQFGNGLIVNSQTGVGPQVAVDSQGNALMGGLTQGAFTGFSNPNNATEMFLAKFGP